MSANFESKLILRRCAHICAHLFCARAVYLVLVKGTVVLISSNSPIKKGAA